MARRHYLHMALSGHCRRRTFSLTLRLRTTHPTFNPADAYAWGGNTGVRLVSHVVGSAQALNIDGVYYKTTVSYYDMGFDTTGAGNLRQAQIVRSNNTEHIGAGYFSGCFYTGFCTDRFSSKIGTFVEWRTCAVLPCTGYQQRYYYGVSPGTLHTIQIQRKFNGSQYVWQVWMDGSMRDQFNIAMAMGSTLNIGAENTNPPHGARSMWGDFDNVKGHANGQASTTPPSDANYSTVIFPFTAVLFDPGCLGQIYAENRYRFSTSGTC